MDEGLFQPFVPRKRKSSSDAADLCMRCTDFVIKWAWFGDVVCSFGYNEQQRIEADSLRDLILLLTTISVRAPSQHYQDQPPNSPTELTHWPTELAHWPTELAHWTTEPAHWRTRSRTEGTSSLVDETSTLTDESSSWTDGTSDETKSLKCGTSLSYSSSTILGVRSNTFTSGFHIRIYLCISDPSF